MAKKKIQRHKNYSSKPVCKDTKLKTSGKGLTFQHNSSQCSCFLYAQYAPSALVDPKNRNEK